MSNLPLKQRATTAILDMFSHNNANKVRSTFRCLSAKLKWLQPAILLEN